MIIYIASIIYAGKLKTLFDDNLNSLIHRVKKLMIDDTESQLFDMVEIEKTEYSYNFEYLYTLSNHMNQTQYVN